MQPGTGQQRRRSNLLKRGNDGEVQLASAHLLCEDSAGLRHYIQLNRGVAVMQMLTQPGKQPDFVILVDPQPHPPGDLSGLSPVDQAVMDVNK